MQNHTVHLGSATPLSSQAGPRAPADRPAPPVGDTAARHCAAAHPSAPSLPALSGRHARATQRSGHCRAPSASRGQAPWHPRTAWHPTPGTPTFSLPFPLCHAAAEPLAPRSRCTTHCPIPTPLRPLLLSARASPPLPAPGPPPLPRGFRSSTAAICHSPVSSSPSCQSPKFLANPALPRLSRAAGLHHPHWRPPEPPPHRRTPPPDAICTASPSTRRSGAPLPSPPCPTPSP
jgi:hypothetical protein